MFVSGASLPGPQAVAGALVHAQEYAARGWLVVPLHTVVQGKCSCGRAGCSSPGKHPRTSNGSRGGTHERAQLDRWWRRWPEANVGLVTGVASGLVVLDVDRDHGGQETLAGLEGEWGPLPATVTADTGGGGLHLLFAHPGGMLRN